MITARFIQKEKTLYFLSRSIFINIRSFSINVWSLHPLSVNYALCTISICVLYGVKIDTISWYDNISANISYIVLYYCDHDQYSNFNLLHIYSMVTNLMDFSPGVASCRFAMSQWPSPERRAEFCHRRRSQFVEVADNNMSESHWNLFTARCSHSCLSQKGTRFYKSQVLTPAGATVLVQAANALHTIRER